jgi:hypothetical protein
LSKILAGFTVLSLLLILLGINRGFDISDEGVYALLAVPSQENIAGIFNYDLFFKLFYKATGIEFGLIGLRGLRLLTCFVAAGALTVFWSNFKIKLEHKFSIFLIAFLGVLSSYGFLAQTLSYNSINLMCGCLWLALISSRRYTNQDILLVGMILSLLYYSKVTVCLILTILTICFLVAASDKSSWAKNLLLLSIPFLLLELLFFFSLGESGILRALAAKEMLDYRPDYHFMTIVKYSYVGVFWSSMVVLPFVLAGYLKSIHSCYYKSVLGVGLAALCLIAYFTTITNEINHVLLLATLAVLGFLIGASSLSKINLREAGFLLLLIVFPFILHFGSNVYFLRIGIHYWVFWLLAIRFFVEFFNYDGKVIFQFLLPILTLALIMNGISLYAFSNYRYFEPTVSFEYRKGKSIILPVDEVSIYSKLKNETSHAGFNEILPVFRNPGLVYMIGKEHPKTPGIWSRQQVGFFFPDSENLSVILYNNTFEFPFERKNWREGSSFKFSGDEYVTIFWKE